VQLFRSRRSIRSYKREPVPGATLEELLNISRWAPTAKNVQPVHWIVLQKAEDVAGLSAMVIDWMRARQIQPHIVQAFDQGWDIIHRGAPCLLVAHASSSGIKPVEDCCIAMATVEAAAPAFGLGACWAGFFMSAAKEHQPIHDFLRLPEGHGVFAALMLGYPRVSYYRIPPRQELKVQWR
jgi:nitroreductase